MANTLFELRARDERQGALGRLPELYRLRDELLHELDRLLQAREAAGPRKSAAQ